MTSKVVSKVTFPWTRKKDPFKAYEKATDIITKENELDQLEDGMSVPSLDFHSFTD